MLILLNKYEFFKMCKIFHILHFILKIYHNFKSYQNRLTTLGFCFLYFKLQFFLGYVMHITPHLHMVTDSWKFKNLKNILNFKILKIPYLLNCECFLNLGSMLLSSKFSYHQNYVITIILYLILCKINHIWCITYSSSNVLFKKPKPKI